jgi:hypothetical protein
MLWECWMLIGRSICLCQNWHYFCMLGRLWQGQWTIGVVVTVEKRPHYWYKGTKNNWQSMILCVKQSRFVPKRAGKGEAFEGSSEQKLRMMWRQQRKKRIRLPRLHLGSLKLSDSSGCRYVRKVCVWESQMRGGNMIVRASLLNSKSTQVK